MQFPFLIGRDSLNAESDVFYDNDLTPAEERPYVVSRNHPAVVQEHGRRDSAAYFILRRLFTFLTPRVSRAMRPARSRWSGTFTAPVRVTSP